MGAACALKRVEQVGASLACGAEWETVRAKPRSRLSMEGPVLMWGSPQGFPERHQRPLY